MRAKSRLTGSFPTRLYGRLRKLANPEKPLFVGDAAGGVRFLGDFRDYPSVSHVLNPAWNEPIAAFLADRVAEREGIFVDVGANIGFVSAFVWKRVGRSIVSVEPVPQTAFLARGTLRLNRADVVLHEIAAGDEEAEVLFQASLGNSAVASLHRHDFGYLGEWSEIRVPMRRLDSLIGPETPISVMKFDVEGAEPRAIAGAMKAIGRSRPTLVFEYTPQTAALNRYDLDALCASLATLGYRFEVLHQGGGLTSLSGTELREQVNIVARVVS